MRKLMLIARSNMRKAVGQTVAIVVLMLIAALMLNLWLMLSTDYKANFDRCHDRLNAEHVTLAVDDPDAEFKQFASDLLGGDGRVAQYSTNDCLHMVINIPYNGGEMNCDCVLTEKELSLSRDIGKAEIVEDGAIDSGIYLPMIYKTGDIYVGGEIELSIGSQPVKYTVCGFFNSAMLGSHNCALTQLILTEDKYLELESLGFAPKATLISVRLKDKSDSLNFESELKSAVTERFPSVRAAGNSYAIVEQSRYISQSICSGIMSAMAFLVLMIALVVIASNIVNYIQVNMKNLGALKAVGYTSRQLILSLLFQFSAITLIAAIVGAATSYAIFPAVNAMMISQTGIPYSLRFLPLPFFLSLVILLAAVAVATYLAARRIKRIEPIVALRFGITTHSFKRNRVPLDKTKAPLNLALALKSTLSGIKHNVTVCITMLVLSLVVVFSGLMTENVIVDMTPFLDLIVGETADSAINVTSAAEADFLAEMDADNRVEKAYLFNSITLSHVGGVELMANIYDDFGKLHNRSVVFKGRFPKYDNELALGAKYAKEQGLDVGDEIEISSNGGSGKYIICGLTQISNNLGRDCLLTREGYERMSDMEEMTYYIDLADGVDIDTFNADMKELFSGRINAVVNVDATMQSAASVYVSLMTIIVIAILALSLIVIAFVLYLLVRTMLNNKMRDYGIMKSLGFTSKQLIAQTALSFMPSAAISTVVGLIIGALVINPLLGLFLSGLGIVKCTFKIPVVFIIVAGVMLIAATFGIASLLSLRVKKISPRELLASE